MDLNASQSIRTLQVGGTDRPGLYNRDFISCVRVCACVFAY